VAKTQESQETGRPVTQVIADTMALPFDVVREALPQRGLPVYVGLGALTVANLIDLPIAIAAGLGYVALRGWRRPGAEASAAEE
jgi:hypothetical protein